MKHFSVTLAEFDDEDDYLSYVAIWYVDQTTYNELAEDLNEDYGAATVDAVLGKDGAEKLSKVALDELILSREIE